MVDRHRSAGCRYALRGFQRNPLFSISVVATLALAPGQPQVSSVWSIAACLPHRPIGVRPDCLVRHGALAGTQGVSNWGFYLEWKDNQKPFGTVASQSTMPHPCDLVENNPAQLDCISFQADFFPLFGISPLLGRNFLPEEDRPNGPRVVMISYALWRGHFASDQHIVDRNINIDGDPARIIGVLPASFQFPTLESADVIFPMAFNPAIQQTTNGGFGNPMRTFARLKPGVSIEQAYAQMQPLFNGDLKWFPASAKSELRLSIRSLRDRETQDVQPVAWILLGFVLAVLLIACANVASLMMARGASRGRNSRCAWRSAQTGAG